MISIWRNSDKSESYPDPVYQYANTFNDTSNSNNWCKIQIILFGHRCRGIALKAGPATLYTGPVTAEVAVVSQTPFPALQAPCTWQNMIAN